MGLSPLEIGLMSILVFAGSSQFIAVSMISAGATALPIIITTLMVNLRHFLMSSALAVYFKEDRRENLSLFAYGVTDESFAVNHTRLTAGDWDLHRSIAVNQCAHFTWIVSTVIGGYGGQFIPRHALGIDYALIAMFICLLVFQLKGRIYVVTAVVAGISSVILSAILPGNVHVILASLIAATTGAILRTIKNHGENRSRWKQNT